MRWTRKTLAKNEHEDKLDLWVHDEYAIGKSYFAGVDGWMYEIFRGPKAETFYTGTYLGATSTLKEAKAIAEADMEDPK